jgi:large subunit ribosomal protein L18
VARDAYKRAFGKTRLEMANKQKDVGKRRERRRFHVRNSVRSATNIAPRLSVFRSLENISCQIIDDSQGKTLVSAGTRDRDIRSQIGYGGNCKAATEVGKTIAERAIAAGIKNVKFDRGHCKYHGRIKALADAAREAGLKF